MHTTQLHMYLCSPMAESASVLGVLLIAHTVFFADIQLKLLVYYQNLGVSITIMF